MLWFPFSVSMFMTDENSYLPAVTLGFLAPEEVRLRVYGFRVFGAV